MNPVFKLLYTGMKILTFPLSWKTILHSRLFFHVKSFISPHQHGFFPGRSITSNLLNFSEYCITELYSGGQVDVIYTDIEDYELA